MTYVVEARWAGRILKEYLFSELSLSRAQVVVLKKKEQGMLLNGERVTVRAILREGDLLELELEDEQSSEDLIPYDYPLQILYEDEDLILINKPQGMPTHPSHGHFEDTLANALACYYQKQGRPFVFRAANRLDRDTTGVVLVAKNKRASAALSRQIMTRRVKKEYFALLQGTLRDDEGCIDKNIVRALDSVILRSVSENEGERAFTTYRVLERRSGLTLVSAQPHTGRTHQLRVHFASIGHPIFGDGLYGTPSDRICGQALHAFSLTFFHPISERELTVCAPLHPEFCALLKEYNFEFS
ncbi:MAG: RluA family pseudouridine synthase [Clostridia bacterium]|nr:RluA family pseudouridine synthase [Clostridia bacterium]